MFADQLIQTSIDRTLSLMTAFVNYWKQTI